MMGYINNLVIRMVEEAKGDEAVEALFKKAGIARKNYQNEVIYSETEFQSLFIGAQAVLDVDREAAEKAFASYSMRSFQRQFSWVFRLSSDTRGFFEKVPRIHGNFPESQLGSQNSDKLYISESVPDRLVFHYCSPNRLCVYLCALVFLALEYFGETGEVEETSCMKKGAHHCSITIRFLGKKAGT